MAEETRHKLLGEFYYENMWLPGNYSVDILERVRKTEFAKDDVVIAGYPKTGTHWTQEMTWLIHSEGDLETASKIPVSERVQYLELDSFEGERKASLDVLEELPHPWMMKSHLPAQFFTKQLESGLKVILVVRNPKDTLVSFYHFYCMCRAMGNFKGTWNEFFELYKAKNMFIGDYFDWYMSWVPFLDHPNLTVVKYEDMKVNPMSTAMSIAKVLGKDLPQSTMEFIVSNLSFNKMIENNMPNYEGHKNFKQEITPFMRKGVVGDWKNYFTEEQCEFVDKRYAETLEKAGLMLQFEQ